MVNGSNTPSEQEHIAKPLTDSNPVKDEIEEGEMTIAMLTGEILRAERNHNHQALPTIELLMHYKLELHFELCKV